jgi:hypothetical protein
MGNKCGKGTIDESKYLWIILFFWSICYCLVEDLKGVKPSKSKKSKKDEKSPADMNMPSSSTDAEENDEDD